MIYKRLTLIFLETDYDNAGNIPRGYAFNASDDISSKHP